MSNTIVKEPQTPVSLSDCLAVGEVLRLIPRELVDKALTEQDRSNRRHRQLPDHLVVYFVILMAMFMDHSYLHILEKLGHTLSWLQGAVDELEAVTVSAVVQARQRIGLAPLKSLFKLFALPLASEATPGAFFHGLRLVVIDGSTFTVEDSVSNAKTFGRSANQQGSSGTPKVHCVALLEYATRVFIDVIFGPYQGSSEKSLSLQLLGRLQPGMLCLGDRLYPSYESCKLVIGSGAHFAWRVKKDFKLKPLKTFADGSYEARMYLYINRKRQKEFVTVRVVEYTVSGHSEKVRIITDILDPKMAPARELAQLYPARWSQETVYGEIKLVLRCRQIVLRSKSPEMVEQELYGLFLAHYVVRYFMFLAASQKGIPPDTLSFKHSLFVIKENLPKLGDFSP